MNDVEPHPAFLAALHSPELVDALPRLLAYAERSLRRMGWGEDRDHICGEAQAQELVHSAVETGLRGGRIWKEGMSLETYLCGIMWSELSHRRRGSRRGRKMDLDEVAEPMAPSSRRNERLAACLLLEQIKRAIVGDAEVEALVASIEGGGEKPADHAATLGWTPELVKAVKARMKRRLAAAGLDKDDDGDGSEREGGPRGAPEAGQLPRRGLSHR